MMYESKAICGIKKERVFKDKKLGLKTLVAIAASAVVMGTVLFLAFDYGEKRRGEYSQIRENSSERYKPSCFINTITDKDQSQKERY